MRTVDTGILRVPYFIREMKLDPGTEDERTRFDWVLLTGAQSDEYFKTAEDARIDVENYLE